MNNRKGAEALNLRPFVIQQTAVQPAEGAYSGFVYYLAPSLIFRLCTLSAAYRASGAVLFFEGHFSSSSAPMG